jgi:serine/threonine protein kinase
VSSSGYTIVADVQIDSDVSIRRARRDSDNRPVIIKSAPKDNEIALDRLRNHYKFCADKEISGVPRVYDLVSTPDELQLIMEDTGSATLNTLVRRGPVDIGEGLLIAEQILVALDALHGMNILHRDMSLANVIYDPQTHHTTIADLGLAVSVHPNRPEYNSQRVEGTLAFMSPEQTGRTQKATDARSDIYSTGIVLYTLFTGQAPFQCNDALEYFHAHLAINPKSPTELREQIPDALSRLIMHMIAKDPDDRYQSVYGILEDIRRIKHLYVSGANTAAMELMLNDSSARFDTSGKLFGRSFELALLNKQVASAISDGPLVFTVFGALGSGKSALLEEFAKNTRAQGITVLHGKHEQYSGGLPATGIHTIIHAFQSKILKLPSSEVHTWSQRLQHALGENAVQLVRVFPELSVLLRKQEHWNRVSDYKTHWFLFY